MIIGNQGSHRLVHPYEFSSSSDVGENNGDSSNVSSVTPCQTFYHQLATSMMTQIPPSQPYSFQHNSNEVTPLSMDFSRPEGLSSDGSNYRLPFWGICLMIVAYACVFIFGVIGNCAVLIVVARLRRMKTVTNFLICNLALSDLLVLLFCLLPNLISNIFVPWILGRFLCKTVPYIQGVSVCASVYSLVAISVERCISIQWPFQYQITKKRAGVIMCAIWIWSFTLCIPWLIYFDIEADVEYPDADFCIEKWPKPYENWSKYYFLIGNFILCYILPLGIIFIAYLIIWYRVWFRRPVPTDSNHKVHVKNAKTAVLKMLIIVVVTFAISFLGIYSINLRLRFGGEMSDLENEIISYAYPIAQWVACSNSAISCYLYSYNKKFRHGFYMIFKCSWNQNHHHHRHPPPVRTHKSPTVNLLLRRMAVYKVRTSSMYRDSDGV